MRGENRNPKSESRRKSETRNPKPKAGSARTESLAKKWQVKNGESFSANHNGRAAILRSRVQTEAPKFSSARSASGRPLGARRIGIRRSVRTRLRRNVALPLCVGGAEKPSPFLPAIFCQRFGAGRAGFGFRASDFFRISAFGLRISLPFPPADETSSPRLLR